MVLALWRIDELLGEGGGSLVIEFITHKHQSSSAMSSTIFSSLTTFFSGGGHHSSPHPTIPPNQQIPSQIKLSRRGINNENGIALMYHAWNFMPAVGTTWPSRVIQMYNVTAPGHLMVEFLENIKGIRKHEAVNEITYQY
ncbi:hypothetical protein Hanom_Chr04g00373451 [Helianthus anomalus]